MPNICNNGCNYFIYGKGSKSNNCYWEKTSRSSPCSEGWEADEYDFYNITNYHHSDDSRPYNLNSIMHYSTGGSHCTGNGICMKGKGGKHIGRRTGGFDSNDLSQIFDTFGCSSGKEQAAAEVKEQTATEDKGDEAAAATELEKFRATDASQPPARNAIQPE